MDNEFETKNPKKRESLLKVFVDSFLTLVVIVLIVGFLFTLKKHMYWLTVIIGGAFLLVIAIIMFAREFEKDRKRNFLLPIITCLIGSVTVFCGVMLKKDPEMVKAFVLKYALLFAMILILSVGVGFLFYAITEQRRKRRYCTVRVFGECCGFATKFSSSRGGHRVHAPIYKFYFGEEEYCVAEKSFSRFFNPLEGEKRELYVDTETMDEIYEPIRSGKLRKFTYGLGFCITVLSMLGLLMMYY
ncbi:MAG: hypothetical protein IKB07_13475 [Lachnospiraceae bacterium]|nr:hypothetical protein [Lachnospiraceae bacterium]